MTLHVQRLYEVAKHAKAMADAMQAIVDDCAEQLAQRKAAGESDAAMLNEVFGGEKSDIPSGMMPYDGPTPFDEKHPAVTPAPPIPEKPKMTIVELRAFVAERSTPENRTKIKAILTKYGVKKLTELKESQYEAVKNEVAAL